MQVGPALSVNPQSAQRYVVCLPTLGSPLLMISLLTLLSLFLSLVFTHFISPGGHQGWWLGPHHFEVWVPLFVALLSSANLWGRSAFALA